MIPDSGLLFWATLYRNKCMLGRRRKMFIIGREGMNMHNIFARQLMYMCSEVMF